MTAITTAPRTNEVSQPTQRPPTGIAVVGCGYWGGNYVRVFQELVDSEVRVVCDARPEQLAHISRQFPHIPTTSSLEEALADPFVDAAIVVTTATTHYEITRQVLDAGKHVLVEKPLTTDTATSRKLVEQSRDAGLVLLVGHTFLYNGAVRTLREHVDPEEVYYLYAQRTSLGPIRSDVNAVWDLAPHDISIFNYLLDSQPRWVSAIGSRVLRSEREDVAFITLGYPGDILAHIYVSWADPNKVRQVVVVSSGKRVVFNDVDPLERVRIFEKGVRVAEADEEGEEGDGLAGFGEHLLQLRDGDIISPSVKASEPLKNQCGHFLHCVRRDEPVLTSGDDGLAIVAVMEAIDASLARQGARVEVEIP